MAFVDILLISRILIEDIRQGRFSQVNISQTWFQHPGLRKYIWLFTHDGFVITGTGRSWSHLP